LEFDVCVGMTLEVRLHRFMKKLKWSKRGAKDRSVSNPRRGIRILYYFRGDVISLAPPL